MLHIHRMRIERGEIEIKRDSKRRRVIVIR